MHIRSIFIFILLGACSGGGKGGGGGADAPPVVDMFATKCGAPGDLGNELGIGKFCGSLGDCSTTTDAPLCSSLGDPETHFCTKTCPMGSTDQCGTNTTCTCNSSNQCGCTPNSCL
jgi:hypothetical protein